MRTHWEFQMVLRKLGGREAEGLGQRESVQRSMGMGVGEIIQE